MQKRTITTKQLAARWGVDPSRIRRLAAEGRIVGAHRIGEGPRAIWTFPADAQRLSSNEKRPA